MPVSADSFKESNAFVQRTIITLKQKSGHSHTTVFIKFPFRQILSVFFLVSLRQSDAKLVRCLLMFVCNLEGIFHTHAAMHWNV